MAIRIVRRAHGVARSLSLRRAANISQNAVRPYSQQKPELDIDQLLSTPTWSVSSLLPSSSSSSSTPQITSKQLHHMLRLSALPPPKDAAEELKMLSTFSSQLHFVKDIQQMDTTGVEPLRSLRDETQQGEKEAELGLDALKVALENEEIRGRWHKRIRRQRKPADSQRWDVLGCASKKVGRYFVVEGGKDG
ncbi:hypothetical protein CB0940_00277 [Cercospora beticola]|uniref:Glutamyl-tRNA amidotransferase complex subunit Gta3 domain-containing protein n=2 Tax=Cercospora beticola TaxID=122368 RepID=A0A2G5IBV2_CERBT|nr:hypothetical protein CB0940_00277 [Cercospora beticola]PIB02327.1 hypothetical protein CB0940_00277 [Cercospora beticola]